MTAPKEAALPRAVLLDIEFERCGVPVPRLDEKALAKGRVRRWCKDCRRWIEEDMDGDVPKTSRFLAHYVEVHERAKYLRRREP